MQPSPSRRHTTPAAECHRHPIVTGYDGSPASMNALAYAAGLARRGDHWLVIVRIWRLGRLIPPPFTAAAHAERVRQIQAELAVADLSGLDVQILSRVGDPADELLKAIAEHQADALVIGAARRFRHLASLPARLVGRARCPAIVVP